MPLQKWRTEEGEGVGRQLQTLWTLKALYPPPSSSRTLKPEAKADEDGVVMCSGPEEGEEVGQEQAQRQ